MPHNRLGLQRPVAVLTLVIVAGFSCRSPTMASQVNALTFRTLTVPELERQAAGTVRLEDAFPRAEIVFDSPEAWIRMFAASDTAALPVIDFSQKRAVGIFLGASGPGHQIRIDQVSYNQSAMRTTVAYTVLLPSPDRIYPAVIVFPSLVAEIDRRPGTVVFDRREAVSRE